MKKVDNSPKTPNFDQGSPKRKFDTLTPKNLNDTFQSKIVDKDSPKKLKPNRKITLINESKSKIESVKLQPTAIKTTTEKFEVQPKTPVKNLIPPPNALYLRKTFKSSQNQISKFLSKTTD